MQPSDKIHNYFADDLVQAIKDTYNQIQALSEEMDKVLDHTTHLPNFRYKCRIFIEMGREIDKLTMIAINNLKATKQIER